MSSLGLILLFLSPIVGGLLVLLVKESYARQLKFVLTFCGGFLFATAILHLLPEVFQILRVCLRVSNSCGFYWAYIFKIKS